MPSFNFMGYTFEPYRDFTAKEKAATLHDLTMKFGLSDSPLFRRSDVSRGRPSLPMWDYNRFYAAAGCNTDIFKVNGCFVIPCQNYLAIAKIKVSHY